MNRTLALLALAALLLAAAVVSSSRSPEPAAPPAPLAPVSAPAATEGLSLSAQADHQLISSEGAELTVQVDLKDLEPTPPLAEVSMVLVLDRSGSMAGPKLEQAKAAARAFVGRLSPSDRLGLVHFGTDVVRFPLRAMDLEGKEAALALIDSVSADGATNLSVALEAGSEMLEGEGGSRRLVLASDGEPTMGMTAPDQLVRLLQRIHTGGVTVTALGIGADYNGPLMTRLAEAGGGFYGYLRDAGQLSEILAQELNQARTVNARNVALELLPAAGVTVLGVPGRQLVGGAVLLPDFKSGDEARVFVRLLAGPTRGDRRDLLRAKLTWLRPQQGGPVVTETVARVGVTRNRLEAEDSRDEVVFGNAVRAQGANAMVDVVAAFDQGDRALALSRFADVRRLFGMSANALAEERDSLARAERLLKSASGAEMKHVARDLEQKSLKNFGENNAYGY